MYAALISSSPARSGASSNASKYLRLGIATGIVSAEDKTVREGKRGRRVKGAKIRYVSAVGRGCPGARLCFMCVEVIRNEARVGCHRISSSGPSGSDQPLVDAASGARLVLYTLIAYGAAFGRYMSVGLVAGL